MVNCFDLDVRDYGIPTLTEDLRVKLLFNVLFLHFVFAFFFIIILFQMLFFICLSFKLVNKSDIVEFCRSTATVSHWLARETQSPL